ncbi:MAG: (Fe-S)-binding protein, partial [Euryarchaeota archaeon]|nr:(Fe-S)-binding protein [Euryarchaeota archaeon]
MIAKKLDISKLDVLSLMRYDACTRCGECTSTCPTGGEAQNIELVTPRGKILKLREFYKAQYGLKARLLGPKQIPEDQLKELSSRAYECTICGQCKTVCPAHLDTIEMWENMREFLVANGLAPLPAHESIIKSIENYGNPWLQPRTQRSRWSKKIEKEVKIKDATKEKCEVLFFVGCTAAYDPNIRNMALDTARVLGKANIDFGTLGNDEGCCGSTLLRTGLLESARKLAQRNIEMFEKASPSVIVTSCAGCYKTVRQDYPKVGKVSACVVHITQFVNELIDSGRLKLEKRVDGVVTFHDPCHLGRHNLLYDEPRKILQSIPGIKLVEMERNRAEARCCGAGGGVKTAFPDLAQKIS